MDEPTAALTPPEVSRLFDIIRSLCARGVAIVYISHRLDEVFDIAQRVTILRDGKHVATERVDALSMSNVVELMIGREIASRRHEIEQTTQAAPVVLEVRNLSKAGAYQDVSLRVGAGEIVGLFGLIGSGQLSLTRSIFGAEQADSGTILLDGQPRTIRRIADARRAGIGFVPVDRKVQSLIMGQSVRNNITLSNWQPLSRLGFFKAASERQHAQAWVDTLGIRMAGGIDGAVRYLSGGNQQKAVLARWLEANVRVLILNEPTWGVDVGARSDIYEQLEKLAAQGMAILIVSSDIEEILLVSHRILTMYRGRIMGEFTRESASKDHLLASVSGDTP
jgi:ABC-type sugar transport system ATPase subunit